MKKISLIITLIILGSIILVNSGSGQGRQTGTLAGTVLDPENNPLPGVTVTLSGPAMMGETSYLTSETGKFRFVALNPGEYDIKVELTGFKTYIRKGLRVSVGKVTEIDIVLEPAPVAEEVTVVAASPVVDVESAKISINYGSDFLLSLPQSRDLFGLQQ